MNFTRNFFPSLIKKKSNLTLTFDNEPDGFDNWQVENWSIFKFDDEPSGRFFCSIELRTIGEAICFWNRNSYQNYAVIYFFSRNSYQNCSFLREWKVSYVTNVSRKLILTGILTASGFSDQKSCVCLHSYKNDLIVFKKNWC